MSLQSRFDARYWMLGAGALGRPRGMVWGGRRVQDGEHMYTCGGKKKFKKQKNKQTNKQIKSKGNHKKKKKIFDQLIPLRIEQRFVPLNVMSRLVN